MLPMRTFDRSYMAVMDDHCYCPPGTYRFCYTLFAMFQLLPSRDNLPHPAGFRYV